MIFQQPKRDFFRQTQLFCFFLPGWWYMTFIFDFIYGMSSFPLTFIFSRWLKPPTTYQLNWWCKHEKHGGFPTHLISPRKTDRIFQSEAVFLKGELGQIQERAKAEFSNWAMGFPWEELEVSHGETMENHGKSWENGSLNGKLPRKCWENPMIIDRSHRTQWRWGIFQPWSWLQENIGNYTIKLNFVRDMIWLIFPRNPRWGNRYIGNVVEFLVGP